MPDKSFDSYFIILDTLRAIIKEIINNYEYSINFLI